MKHNFWIYADKREQGSTAAALIVFGAEIFKRAKSIKEIDSLKKINAGINNKSIHPLNYRLSEFFFEYLIDCIRFLIFFENYMKAALIINDYCVHFIDKEYHGFNNLAKEQHTRPIKLEEIHLIENFIIDKEKKTIYHNAIKDKTIGIKELLGSDHYIINFEIENDIILIIKKLNKYRNTLHFNDSIEFQLSDELISNLEIMNNFVNKTIKRINNTL